MFDVFISHARSTTPLARQIVEALRMLGHTVWWDDDLPVHRPFPQVIQERLRGAKAVVVIWSADAIESSWVRSESEFARATGILVQICVDRTVPPMPFEQLQFADLTGWNGDTNAAGWRKVVASVRELVGGDRASVPSIGADEKRASRSAFAPRKRMFAALLLGCAVVVIGATWYGLATSFHPPQSAHSEEAQSNETPMVDTTPDAFANRPAIAVLPFENLSDNPKQAIFADGLAEDLITRLSAWRAFPVIGHRSSFHYRGDVDVKRVAKELNVRYVVQGSVRSDADRIRVTAQLVDARAGTNVWSQSYDRKVVDMFDLQDDISAAIAAPLVGDLTRAEANRARQRGARNLEAWSQYHLGEELLFRFTPEGVAAARPFFERAVALEPQFATAHARLSNAYAWEVEFGLASSRERNLELARESARRAVELDPLDAKGHSGLAFALLLSHDTPNGLAAAQRAVELNPSLPEAWNVLGYAKLMADDPSGCIEANERSARLDPQALALGVNENLSEAHWMLGQFETGLEYARKVVAEQPEFAWGYIDEAQNDVGLGRLDDAHAAIAEWRRIQPDASLEFVSQGSSVTNPATIARRTAALREAGLD